MSLALKNCLLDEKANLVRALGWRGSPCLRADGANTIRLEMITLVCR